MRPIATFVEALHELANTGRLSEETVTKLTDLVTAEKFHHPEAGISCHYEEMESTHCPICRYERERLETARGTERR